MIKVLGLTGIFFLAMLGIMQNDINDSYEELWTEVLKYEKERKPKSGLKTVNIIYEKAEVENNRIQLTRVIIYKAKFLLQLEENAFSSVVDLFKHEIEKSPSPTKEILLSAEASIYQKYLANNFWEIQQRKRIENFETNDPKTWPLNTFHEKISSNYLQSVNTPKVLKDDLEHYDELLDIYDEEALLEMPSLYDVLARKALDYFSNDQNYLTSPSYKFTLNDPKYLASSNEFEKYAITSQDSTAKLFHGITLIQKLLNYHKSNKQAHAAINLKRLNLVYSQGTFKDKNEAYFDQLKKLEKEYSSIPQHADVLAAMASYYYSLPNPENEKSDKFKKALAICNKAIKLYPNHKASSQVFNIYNSIISKHLRVTGEQVNLPDKPFLVKLDYKNISTAYLKLIELNDDDLFQIRNGLSNEDAIKLLKKRKSIIDWKEELINDGLYHQRSIELSIPALEFGYYALVVSENEKHLSKKSNAEILLVSISNLAFEYRSTSKDHKLIVMNRTNGKPLNEVEVSCFKRVYNRKMRNSNVENIGEYISDKNGSIDITNLNRESCSFELKKDNDQLRIFNQYHFSFPNKRSRRTRASIFTDRSIYRPGQIIYFKSLMFDTYENGESKIIADQDFEISFYDGNRQLIKKQVFRTNQFGTFNGSFIAPNNGLKGSMFIEILNYGSSQIKVEEYKRPKFKIEQIPLDTSYQIGDTVIVKAKAISYAGAMIDGAKVTYRLTRNLSFPWWYWGCGYRYPQPARNNMEMTNGHSITNKNGEVEIKFLALPDSNLDTKWNPLYSYTLSITVTDKTGESQFLNQVVRIGKHSKKIEILSLKENISNDEERNFRLKISDLNGNPQSGKGRIEIVELIEPQKVYASRYWSFPDTIAMSQNDFELEHPNTSWNNEDPKFWKNSTKIQAIKFDFLNEDSFELPDLNGGMYKMLVRIKDTNGEEIVQEKIFSISNFKNKKFSKAKILHYALDKKIYKPGDKVNLLIGVNHEGLNVLYRLEKHKELLEEKWLTIKDVKKIRIPVEEADRGGFKIHLGFVVNNRSYSEVINVDVPWANKNLDITFESFRDKTIPGASEEYRIKIKGHDKDKLSAELLMAMYDASLDQFKPHSWEQNFFHNYNQVVFGRYAGFSQQSGRYRLNNWYKDRKKWKGKSLQYPRLYDFGLMFNNVYLRGRNTNGEVYMNEMAMEDEMEMDHVVVRASRPQKRMKNMAAKSEVSQEVNALPSKNIDALASNGAGLKADDKGPIELQIRKNLKETVFFFPDLKTDKEGNLIVSFKMNEALTKWKMLSFAHTKELAYAFDEKEIVTQKDLMIIPNPPRFVRDNDEIVFTAKINNLTDKQIVSTAKLELFNPLDGSDVGHLLALSNATQTIVVEANQSAKVEWLLRIPERKLDVLNYKLTARSKGHQDGEENALPVLTNKLLITESLPLTVDANSTKSFVFEELKEASRSALHQNVTLEYTANPAWNAILAMPYISAVNSKQLSSSIFNRFYTNSLASHIVNVHPKIKTVFDNWKLEDSDALKSSLFKNEKLKSAILNETPWVQKALSENEQKQNIALLFDLNKMANDKANYLLQLKDMQMSDGGFSWFGSHVSNRYISQYILEGFGHLKRLDVIDGSERELNNIIKRLIKYVDQEAAKEYERSKANLSNIAAHYLYARSFFTEIEQFNGSETAKKHFLKLAEKEALEKGVYSSGMLALALNRFGKKEIAKKITSSLLERAMSHPELGMYWNEGSGFRWNELPIERHSLMIELMVEMGEFDVIDKLKLWLLRNKQSNNWKTEKATASAIYALLIENEASGISSWLIETKIPVIKLDGKEIDFSDKIEAGTGYVNNSWNKSEIKSNLAEIEIYNPNNHIGWGSMYWQYFEELDKVKSFEKTPLKIEKRLFKKIMDDKGDKIVPIDSAALEIGDQIIVRLVIKTDRSMEYVHLKDLRASGFEPENVLSSHKRNFGLSYYQSTSDTATDFFISYLPKGEYVFEYPLRVQHAGKFSLGISTIQSMYAPEFVSRSKGGFIEIAKD